MMLIGMFDSPFVRRVAISMRLQGLSFEHRNWSVGADATAIAQYNPLGRVPVLVLDDGEVLIDSAAILDHLDEMAGPARALLPAVGAPRRRALRLCALAHGAVEKGLMLVIEEVFRPADKRHPAWLARCKGQIENALTLLESECAALADGQWLMGAELSQPDITLACVASYLRDAARIDLTPYPALAGLHRRAEALEVFQRFYLPFFTPEP